MRVLKNILILMATVVFSGANAYDDKLWLDQEDTECSGINQSPIEVNSDKAFLYHGASPLKFNNFNVSFDGTLTNNGHSVELTVPGSNNYSISGGPLGNARFVTLSAHGHWGSGNNHGSEHVVNNRRFSFEMHFVNRNSKYNSTEEAVLHSDGLAVVAIFFQVEPTQTTEFAPLSKIANALDSIQEYNSSIVVPNITLSEYVAECKNHDYFFYCGSLTTPPCSPAVLWIVCDYSTTITEDQIEAFRTLLDESGDPMVNNYRGLQPIGSRTVWRISNNNGSHNSCSNNSSHNSNKDKDKNKDKNQDKNKDKNKDKNQGKNKNQNNKNATP